MRSVVGSMLSDLGVAASVVIVGGAVLGVYRWSGKWYRATIGSRRDLARRLNQLAAGVTVRYGEERFGTPAFVRAFPLVSGPTESKPARRRPVRQLVQILADPNGAAIRSPVAPRADASRKPPASMQPLRELVYREKHAWVQILADENDAVVRFSITVTDPRFRFKTGLLTWGGLRVRLGHSRFSDVRTGFPVGGRSLRIGAHNHEYAEAYWFGNPGNYQHYVISSNEIGTGEFGFRIMGQGPSFFREGTLDTGDPLQTRQPFDPEAAYARKFRADTTINTLTVLGPLREPVDLREPRGPDSNHVRVLVPAPRERRQIRRQWRRLNRRLLRKSTGEAGQGAQADISEDQPGD